MFAYLPSASGAVAGLAVVTDQFLCLLGPNTPADAARELYSLLAAAAGFDDVLDAVAVKPALDDFAIVELRDAATRSVNVAVRGSISIDFGGSSTTRLSGSAGATWITGEARGVTTLHLSIDGVQPSATDEAERLPISRGVVSTVAIRLDALPDAEADPVAEPPSTATVPVTLPRLEPKKAAKSSKGSRKPAAAPAKAAKVELSALAGNTVEDRRLRVRLPDGNELDAVVPVVLGRRSWSAEFDTQSSFHVSVPSPRREVSGSHLELAEVDGELVARDLNSTNGTVVLSQSRPPRLLDRGRTTALSLGDVLDIGEGFAIEVVSGSEGS